MNLKVTVEILSAETSAYLTKWNGPQKWWEFLALSKFFKEISKFMFSELDSRLRQFPKLSPHEVHYFREQPCVVVPKTMVGIVKCTHSVQKCISIASVHLMLTEWLAASHPIHSPACKQMASDMSEFAHLFSFTPSVDCISGLIYAIVNENIGSDFGYLFSFVLLFYVC